MSTKPVDNVTNHKPSRPFTCNCVALWQLDKQHFSNTHLPTVSFKEDCVSCLAHKGETSKKTLHLHKTDFKVCLTGTFNRLFFPAFLRNCRKGSCLMTQCRVTNGNTHWGNINFFGVAVLSSSLRWRDSVQTWWVYFIENFFHIWTAKLSLCIYPSLCIWLQGSSLLSIHIFQRRKALDTWKSQCLRSWDFWFSCATFHFFLSISNLRRKYMYVHRLQGPFWSVMSTIIWGNWGFLCILKLYLLKFVSDNFIHSGDRGNNIVIGPWVWIIETIWQKASWFSAQFSQVHITLLTVPCFAAPLNRSRFSEKKVIKLLETSFTYESLMNHLHLAFCSWWHIASLWYSLSLIHFSKWRQIPCISKPRTALPLSDVMGLCIPEFISIRRGFEDDRSFVQTGF